MPPAGGYEAVRYKRNLPFRGPGGAVILGAVTAVCAFGFWRVGLGNLEKRCVTLSFIAHLAYADLAQLDHRELKRETMWSRIYLTPMLIAEGDRDAYRREQAALAREKEIMKDVHGWEVGKSAYHGSRPSDQKVVVL
ncbi:hypothetical protein DL93DRAFT_445656 [Clavulina sp. PMI_390]|nr:hypothetical protein DL93DRAFT_445656 [Clavulina sp. PMI_390]